MSLAMQKTLAIKQLITALVLLCYLSACTKQPSQKVNINFNLIYQNQQVSCDNHQNQPIQLKDFRLYLHNVEIQDQQNHWHTITLAPNQWQNHDTILLDFENAKGQCQSGTTEINTQIRGFSEIKNYQALRFTLGVPFALNHQNPLTAKAPLNHASMHWHWQSGYKFMRGEISYQQQNLRLHIGSLACQGEAHNISHCNKPNRATYTLTDFNGKQDIQISLDALLDFEHKQDNITCMGSDEKPWCKHANSWAGLNQQQPQRMFFVSDAKSDLAKVKENSQ